MNMEETKALLRIIEESYVGFIPTDETAAVWSIILADLPASLAKKATLMVCRSDTKVPCPARILKAARGLNEGALDEPASIIWERLLKLAGQGEVGRRNYEDNENIRTKSAVRCIGGFDALRTAELGTLPFIRKDFIAYYDERKEYQEKKQENKKVIELVHMIADDKKLLK